MSHSVEIIEIMSLEKSVLEELSILLINVVQEGGSIGFLPPLEKEVAMEYWKSVLNEGTVLWVAMVEGKICGTIQLHLAHQQNGRHRAEVAKLMVHPSMRRYGIARQLLTTLEQRAQEEKRSLLVLDTRAGDPSNILYQSSGYVEAGRIPHYAESANGELHDTVFYYKMI